MKLLLQLGVLAAAIAMSHSALAGNVKICHKITHTIRVDAAALPAHYKHGDTQGACPAAEPPAAVPITVVLLRCDSLNGDIALLSASASNVPDVPVQLPVIEGDNCATAAARLLNAGWELKFVTSGAAVTPGEGESGFVTEYTFISDVDDEDDEDGDEDENEQD